MSVFVRRIDELGRLVLPMEFRKALNVDTKCDIAMEIKDGSIILTPNESICYSCGKTIPAKSKYHLCNDCIKAIKEDNEVGEAKKE